MRISTYMNLGRSMIRWVAGTRKTGDGGGCALGMIEIASGKQAELFPSLSQICFSPCDCDFSKPTMHGGCNYAISRRTLLILNAIVHLFNYHVMTKKDWSMDRLIDWVRSVEPADPEEDAHAELSREPAAEGVAQRVAQREEVHSLR